MVLQPNNGNRKILQKKGSIRDNATLIELIVISNLESINALLIREGMNSASRLLQLNKTAISQIESLLKSRTFGTSHHLKQSF